MRADQVVKWCHQAVTYLLTLAFSHVCLLLLATPGKFIVKSEIKEEGDSG
jgi:hypothetical protein